MKLGNYSLKKSGSQGQQKTFLVALKLAEFEFIRKITDIPPILLLDDIFDKFDCQPGETYHQPGGPEQFWTDFYYGYQCITTEGNSARNSPQTTVYTGLIRMVISNF